MSSKNEDIILDEATVARRLTDHPGWDVEGRTLRRTLKFPTFPEAIVMVNRIAEVAERLDHHPDFLISYRQLTLTCGTHKHDAITEADFELVREIDALLPYS